MKKLNEVIQTVLILSTITGTLPCFICGLIFKILGL